MGAAYVGDQDVPGHASGLAVGTSREATIGSLGGLVRGWRRPRLRKSSVSNREINSQTPAP